MVTVKLGDVILHDGEPQTVAGVSVYRALCWSRDGRWRRRCPVCPKALVPGDSSQGSSCST